MLLCERRGQRRSRQIAILDEDLTQAALWTRKLLGERLPQLGVGQEPPLDENPAQGAPSVVTRSRLDTRGPRRVLWLDAMH